MPKRELTHTTTFTGACECGWRTGNLDSQREVEKHFGLHVCVPARQTFYVGPGHDFKSLADVEDALGAVHGDVTINVQGNA